VGVRITTIAIQYNNADNPDSACSMFKLGYRTGWTAAAILYGNQGRIEWLEHEGLSGGIILLVLVLFVLTMTKCILVHRRHSLL
jgi:hypothetical protein